MKTNLCFPITWILLLFHRTASIEVFIKDANFTDFWFKNSYLLGGSGQEWKKTATSANTCPITKADMWLLTETVHPNQTLEDIQLYIEVEAQLTMPCKTSPCRDVFEMYAYLGQDGPKIPFNPKFSFDDKEKQRPRDFFLRNFTHLGNITGNTTSKERVKTSLNLRLKDFSGITFAFRSTGVCGNLFRMKVYHYACEQKFFNSVGFGQTVAPANGTVTVMGNCSMNTVPGLKRGNFVAYCHSNGSWSTSEDMECLCDKGYGSSEDHGCIPCLPSFYKSVVSNEACMSCPNNTRNTRNNQSCVCQDGYYNVSTRPKEFNCYAFLKINGTPSITPVDDRTLNVTWSRAQQQNGENERISYEVECYVCTDKLCTIGCGNVKYSPSQRHLSQTWVLVSDVKVGQTYMFKIFAKNIVNDFVLRDKWKYVESNRFHVKSDGEPSEKREDDDTRTIIIVVCVGCFFVIIVCVLMAFGLRRRKVKSGLLLSNGKVELPTIGRKMYVDPTNYDNPEDAICDFAKEIDPSLLYLEMLIGGGEFGEVYKGSMTGPDGKKFPVAVKTLKKDASPKSEKDFLLEASVMGQFDHPNVVKLEGVFTKYKPWMIVIEFISNGSLDNFLKANDGTLSAVQLINMAKGVAVGMEYLSGMNFVHRDLAARNILVDGRMVCKVSDFGLSRELEAKESSVGEYATTGGKIPIRWTAPEAYKYRKFSSASDVWSFGILLWEIMSFGERPYWEWDNFKVMEEVDRNFRLPSPMNCPIAVHDLMMQCWKEDRVKRPSFAEINVVIDGWIQSPKTMEGDVDLTSALREWLQSIKMSDYLPVLVAAGYHRPAELYGIKEDELKKLGITLIGHRNKILKSIRNLQSNRKGKRAVRKEISLEV